MEFDSENSTFSESSESTSRILGFSLIVVSIPGLFFNVSVFLHFLHSSNKTSFSIMCLSKTISNTFVLLVHFLYNGPCGLLYTVLGSDTLNGYLTQSVTYGIYLLGPLTQTLISINRFLVVWSSPTRIPRYSNQVTVAFLGGFWTIGVYMSTFIGFPDDCRIKLVLPLHWPWVECESDFIMDLVADFLYYVLGLAVFSNSISLLVVARLVWDAKKLKTLSSESQKRRRRTTIRLFIQSCIQDGIYIMDMINSMFFSNIVDEDIGLFMTTFGASILVHLADGFVMFMFHHQFKTTRKISIVSVAPRSTEI